MITSVKRIRFVPVVGSLALVAATLASGPQSARAEHPAIGSRCGVLPFMAPSDPDHVLGDLGASARAAYNHYLPVHASPYLQFKAKHGPPWVIGYSDSFSGNYWRADALATLRADVAAYKKAGLVSKLIYTDSNLKNDVQIQQMRSMIEQRVDLLLAIPNSATAFDGTIAEAYKAGIPVVTLDSPVTSRNAINVDNNNYLSDAKVTQGVVKILGGAGDVAVMDGLAGAPGSVLAHQGTYDVLHTCPGIKIVGDIEGDWNEATSKSQMLRFLATHPQRLDAVITQGSMALGVIQALQGSGRAIVPIGDGNPDKASLAAFRQYIPTKYAASVNPPGAVMDAAFRVGIHVLEGQGLKINAVVADPPLVVGSASLQRWARVDWTVTTPGQSPAPPGTSWLDESILSHFFVHPRALPQGS